MCTPRATAPASSTAAPSPWATRWARPAARSSAPCSTSWRSASCATAWPRSAWAAVWALPRLLKEVEAEIRKMTDAIRYEKDQDNIVVLTMDMPGQSANTMNAVYREAMGKIVERLEAEKDSIAGVIVTSAKKTFFAGGDLNELIKVTKADAPVFYQMILTIKGQDRKSTRLN